MSQYEVNRAKLSPSDWEVYDGQWVAIACDGSCIVAGAPTLEELAVRLAAIGMCAEDVAFEKVDFEDCCYLGGAELM